jgi:hypothetical protein
MTKNALVDLLNTMLVNLANSYFHYGDILFQTKTIQLLLGVCYTNKMEGHLPV